MPLTAIEDFVQRAAVRKIHDEVGDASGLVDLEGVDGAHAPVVDLGGDTRLVEQHVPKFAARLLVGEGGLDCEESARVVLTRHPDSPHAAGSNGDQELETTQLVAGPECTVSRNQKTPARSIAESKTGPTFWRGAKRSARSRAQCCCARAAFCAG